MGASFGSPLAGAAAAGLATGSSAGRGSAGCGGGVNTCAGGGVYTGGVRVIAGSFAGGASMSSALDGAASFCVAQPMPRIVSSARPGMRGTASFTRCSFRGERSAVLGHVRHNGYRTWAPARASFFRNRVLRPRDRQTAGAVEGATATAAQPRIGLAKGFAFAE
jgi:hypothetical protein